MNPREQQRTNALMAEEIAGKNWHDLTDNERRAVSLLEEEDYLTAGTPCVVGKITRKTRITLERNGDRLGFYHPVFQEPFRKT